MDKRSARQSEPAGIDTVSADDEAVLNWSPSSLQKRKIGRSTVISNAVVSKLVRAFRDGLPITSACTKAGISRMAYYRAVERDYQFAQLMEDAQNYQLELAHKTIKRSMKEGDTVTARWYVDKRDARFQPVQSVANNPTLVQVNVGYGDDQPNGQGNKPTVDVDIEKQ